MSTPDPKLALITGATGGIGKATSLALAKEGYSLALHYNSASTATVNELVASVLDIYKSASSDNAASLNVQAFKADLSDFDAVRRLHADVCSAMSDPAVLFLNAGSTCGVSGTRSIADISLDVFEQTWRINTAAPFLLTQLCLPAMERAGWGRIIYNSSVAGLTGGVVGGHYASSKSALHGLTHWLAGAVASKGITVNALAPALVEETAMLPSGGEELKNSKCFCKVTYNVSFTHTFGRYAKRVSEIPVGRFGRPEEMAETVVWMVRNAYLTNKVIAVDGGMFPH